MMDLKELKEYLNKRLKTLRNHYEELTFVFNEDNRILIVENLGKQFEIMNILNKLNC